MEIPLLYDNRFVDVLLDTISTRLIEVLLTEDGLLLVLFWVALVSCFDKTNGWAQTSVELFVETGLVSVADSTTFGILKLRKPGKKDTWGKAVVSFAEAPDEIEVVGWDPDVPLLFPETEIGAKREFPYGEVKDPRFEDLVEIMFAEFKTKLGVVTFLLLTKNKSLLRFLLFPSVVERLERFRAVVVELIDVDGKRWHPSENIRECIDLDFEGGAAWLDNLATGSESPLKDVITEFELLVEDAAENIPEAINELVKFEDVDDGEEDDEYWLLLEVEFFGIFKTNFRDSVPFSPLFDGLSRLLLVNVTEPEL